MIHMKCQALFSQKKKKKKKKKIKMLSAAAMISILLKYLKVKLNLLAWSFKSVPIGLKNCPMQIL